MNLYYLLEAEGNLFNKIVEKIKELFKKLFEIIKNFFGTLLEKVEELTKKLFGPFLEKIKEKKKNKEVKNESVVLYEEKSEYKFYKYAQSDIDNFIKKFEEACKHLSPNSSMRGMYWIPNIYENINKSVEKITKAAKVYYQRCISSFAKEESDPSLLDKGNIERYIYNEIHLFNNATFSGKSVSVEDYTDTSSLIEHGVIITTSNIGQYYKEIYNCAFNSESWKKSIKVQFEDAKDFIKEDEKATISVFKSVHSEDNPKYKNTSYLHKAATVITKELTSACSNFFKIRLHFMKLAMSLTYKIYMISDIY